MKMLRRFLANFCHEIGCENDQTYIFRFIKYLSTFSYTYLPVNIHFQLIIITNVLILTDPAYFASPSCHCDILAMGSRDFWEITLTAKHVFGLFTWKTWKCWMRFQLNWNNHRRKYHFWLIFVKYFTLGWLNILFQINKPNMCFSLRVISQKSRDLKARIPQWQDGGTK